MKLTARAVNITDIIKTDGSLYTESEIIAECDTHLRRDEEDLFLVQKEGATLHVHPTRMWEDWQDIVSGIPPELLQAARGLPPLELVHPRDHTIGPKGALACEPTRPGESRDGIGKTLLQRMGWTGGPLRPGGHTLATLAPLYLPPKSLGDGEKKVENKREKMEVMAFIDESGEVEYASPLPRPRGGPLPHKWKEVVNKMFDNEILEWGPISCMVFKFIEQNDHSFNLAVDLLDGIADEYELNENR